MLHADLRVHPYANLCTPAFLPGKSVIFLFICLGGDTVTVTWGSPGMGPLGCPHSQCLAKLSNVSEVSDPWGRWASQAMSAFYPHDLNEGWNLVRPPLRMILWPLGGQSCPRTSPPHKPHSHEHTWVRLTTWHRFAHACHMQICGCTPQSTHTRFLVKPHMNTSSPTQDIHILNMSLVFAARTDASLSGSLLSSLYMWAKGHVLLAVEDPKCCT